jgi:hypothetical protein
MTQIEKIRREATGMSEKERNLASYTPPGSNYPPYLSINYRNTMVEITVRSEAKPDGTQGETATIRMNLWHFNKVIEDAKKNLP